MLRNKECARSNGVLVARRQTPKVSAKLPVEVVHALQRLKLTNVPASLPMLKLSANVRVGGYIACVLMEHMDCEDHCGVTMKARSSSLFGIKTWRTALSFGQAALRPGNLAAVCRNSTSKGAKASKAPENTT